MDENDDNAAAKVELWLELQLQIDAAVAKPSKAQFERVGRATVEWATAHRSSAAHAARHSGSDLAVDKGNQPGALSHPHLLDGTFGNTRHEPGDTVIGGPVGLHPDDLP
jgi:hypothetical protein